MLQLALVGLVLSESIDTVHACCFIAFAPHSKVDYVCMLMVSSFEEFTIRHSLKNETTF